MTHQRLREKAEVAKAWMGTDWFDDNWSILRPFDFECSDLIKECTPETVLSLLDELDAARKDAERYRWLRKMYRSSSPHMDGTFEHRPPMHALRGRTLDDAIDAALNADGEKGDD